MKVKNLQYPSKEHEAELKRQILDVGLLARPKVLVIRTTDGNFVVKHGAWDSIVNLQCRSDFSVVKQSNLSIYRDKTKLMQYVHNLTRTFKYIVLDIDTVV